MSAAQGGPGAALSAAQGGPSARRRLEHDSSSEFDDDSYLSQESSGDADVARGRCVFFHAPRV